MPEICLSTRSGGHAVPAGSVNTGETFDWNDLIYVLDFFRIGGIGETCFSGESPLVHPDLLDILRYACHRGFSSCLYTQGFSFPWAVDQDSPSLDQVRFVCRMPASSPARCAADGADFLRAHAKMTTLELLVLDEGFDPGPFIETIRVFGLRREISLRIVARTDARQGPGLGPERYGKFLKTFIATLPLFEAEGILPVWARSVPICIFADHELACSCRAGANYNWAASLDFVVYPDLTLNPTAVPPLEDRPNLLELDSFSDIQQRLIQMASGCLFIECETCPSRARRLCAENIFLAWARGSANRGQP